MITHFKVENQGAIKTSGANEANKIAFEKPGQRSLRTGLPVINT